LFDEWDLTNGLNSNDDLYHINYMAFTGG